MTRREEDDKAEVQALASRARAAVTALARRVKVLIEKGDRAAEKAEQFYKAAGIHIRQIKEESLDNWETIVREQDCGRQDDSRKGPRQHQRAPENPQGKISVS